MNLGESLVFLTPKGSYINLYFIYQKNSKFYDFSSIYECNCKVICIN